AGAEIDSAREIARRGAMRLSHLTALGGRPPEQTREVDGWLIDESAWQAWTEAALPAVTAWAERDPLDPAMPVGALRRTLQLPSDAIAAGVAAAAALAVRDGRVQPPTRPDSLGPAEPAVRRLEERLQQDPFAAPEAQELQELRLGRRELGAAERSGRLLRLPDQIILLPSAPAEAVRRLRALPQPFTMSEARAALNTSRRVAIPLLEHLDARGDTERLDSSRRRVRPLQ
ncbi:MAG TPA: SelB C-terminal domain-containing protein, partial [Jatrophihabitans sp.]|nr:SelB C-terminal domain-containing protein [Jatrophihabitans sp.]